MNNMIIPNTAKIPLFPAANLPLPSIDAGAMSQTNRNHLIPDAKA
jgi:hypothetical protein